MSLLFLADLNYDNFLTVWKGGTKRELSIASGSKRKKKLVTAIFCIGSLPTQQIWDSFPQAREAVTKKKCGGGSKNTEDANLNHDPSCRLAIGLIRHIYIFQCIRGKKKHLYVCHVVTDHNERGRGHGAQTLSAMKV